MKNGRSLIISAPYGHAARQLCELDSTVRENGEASAQLAQLWDARPGGVPAAAAALQARQLPQLRLRSDLPRVGGIVVY